MLIAIAGISDLSNTAQYFRNALSSSDLNVKYISDISSVSSSDDVDILIVVDPFFPDPEQFLKFNCPIVGYLIDVHQYTPLRMSYARFFDHVFVAQKDYLESFRGLPHPSVTWLPLGCDPSVHHVVGLDRIYDVGFVGKMGAAGSERRAILEAVLPRFKTNDHSVFISPPDMGRLYSQSKIVFNKSINGDLNMRAFEAMASGALLVTDRISNGIDEIVEEDVHYVAYSDANEAIEKIVYYLHNEEARRAIARCGQEHMFAKHTYGHRLKTILDVVTSTQERPAPTRFATPRLRAEWRAECLMHNGASLGRVACVLSQEKWSRRMLMNLATATLRGVIRPMRNRINAMRARA